MNIDFYALSRPVQDRFADSTRAIGVPSPIVREAAEDRRAAYWFAAAAVVLSGLVPATAHGIGDLSSSAAIASPALAVGVSAGVAAFVYCLLRGLSRVSARAQVPYEPGLYLFPAGVFDARTEPLRVFLQSEFKEISVVDASKLRVVTEREEFLFRFPSAEIAEQARSALEEGGQAYSEALRAENRREQAMLDPLIDSGFSSPFSPRHKLARKQPLWAKFATVVAVLAGVVVGPTVWRLRNVVSEKKLYARAITENDVSSYRAYLARGGSRKDVAELLLPRAELAVAMRKGTVQGIEEFQASHPKTKIQSEIGIALRAAVGAEFEQAKRASTITALREFKQRRARYHFFDADVEAATVAIYRSLLAAFVPGKAPETVSLFERLLGYSKAHGPTVAIRFVRRMPDSVQAADTQVKLSGFYMGKPSIPSQYFAGDYAEHRESALAEHLASVIGSPFPKDVIDVHVIPALVDATDLPAISEPTLFIDYAPEMAGGYMSSKPRGVFVAVGLTFKASFRLPGDDQPLEFKSSQWHVPNPQILKKDGATVADVYEKMAQEGFSKFDKDFSSLLGAPDRAD